MKLFVVLFSIGLIIMGLYVFMVLTFTRNVRLGHKYLGLYVLMLVANALFLFLYETRLLYSFPHFVKVSSPIILIGIPSVFLSIKKILNNESTTSRRELLLFVPSLFETIRLAPFYLQKADVKLGWVDAIYSNPYNIIVLPTNALLTDKVFFFFNVLFSTALTIYTYMIIRKDMNRHSTQRGRLSRLQLSFARTIFILIVGSYFAYIILGLSSVFYPMMAYYLSLSIVIPLTYVLIYLLSKPEILHGWDFSEPSSTDDSHSDTRSNRVAAPYLRVHDRMLPDDQSSLKKPLAEHIQHVKQMESVLNSTGFYLESGFTIEDLAREMGLTVKCVRESIFAVYKLNFKQYVNHLKIEYFIRKMKSDPKWRQYKIEAISNLLGYQSPTSFYNSFRTIHGCTPKEYIDRHVL